MSIRSHCETRSENRISTREPPNTGWYPMSLFWAEKKLIKFGHEIEAVAQFRGLMKSVGNMMVIWFVRLIFIPWKIWTLKTFFVNVWWSEVEGRVPDLYGGGSCQRHLHTPHPKPFRHDKLLVLPCQAQWQRLSRAVSCTTKRVWTWNPEPFWGLGVPDRLYITEPSLLALEYWLLFWSCCNLIDQSVGQNTKPCYVFSLFDLWMSCFTALLPHVSISIFSYSLA